jgi:hypothetical protein
MGTPLLFYLCIEQADGWTITQDLEAAAKCIELALNGPVQQKQGQT